MIPDSLEVVLRPGPSHNTDVTSPVPLTQHATATAILEEERQESQALHPRSTHSSPIDAQMVAREHQTDEGRVEMLTQVGRRALHEQAQGPPSTSPTQNDTTDTPIPRATNVAQCQSKTAVSPVILQNLGVKRSRPRCSVQPIVMPAKASENQFAPVDTEHDENHNLEDLPSIKSAIEASDSSPPDAIEAGVPEPVSSHSPRYENPLSKGTSRVLLGHTTRSRRQRSPLVARHSGELDRMSRPVVGPSPLDKYNQGNKLCRLAITRSPLESRGSTKKISDGQDDMYLTFGLMIKAKEREELLEEKV